MNRNYLVGLLVVLVVGGWFYFNQNNPDDETSDSQPQLGGVIGLDDFEVTMKDYKLSPKLIDASPGETVKVLLVNKKGTHDFVLDELNVRSSILNTGEEEVIEITIPSNAVPGTEYEFYCSVGNHRQLGMVGMFRIK